MSQEEKELVVQNLQLKIKSLISIYERSIDENKQLFNEKQLLLVQNKEKDQEIEKLQKELDNLRIGNAMIYNEKDNEQISEMRHEAKIKINRMVREIDRCISLLNKLH